MKTSIKSLTIIFGTLFFALPGVSQNVTGGLSAAASFNSVELKNTQSNIKETENLIGVEGGVFLKVPVGTLYLRPMAVASYVKGTVNYANAESEKTESDFSFSILDVPVLLELNLFSFFAIEAGPSWSYLMNYNNDLNGVSVSFNRHSLGYRAGARLQFSSLGIFGHYGGIINKNRGDHFDLARPSRFIVGLTLQFGGEN